MTTSKIPFLRTPYNYDRNAASNETALSFDPTDTPTQQQFKDECDINVIVQRFGLTGELPEQLAIPQSGDFSHITDFQSAMQMVRAAEEEFMRVPAHIRARFNNDPQQMMTFLENEANRDEATKLGLLQPAPEQTRPIPVVLHSDPLAPPPAPPPPKGGT